MNYFTVRGSRCIKRSGRNNRNCLLFNFVSGAMKWRSRIQVPVKTQLSSKAAHPKNRMRKRSLFVGILAAFLLLLVISGGVGKLRDSLVFYARVARLYTETPESRIAMPVQDVSRRHVADTWHAPRGTRVHEGQDIFAPKGTPVLSATSGYLYNIGENNLGGQTVSVIGRGGRVYYYAHLDSYNPTLKEGDFVTTKTILGYVGTTGNAKGTPPHLHFGVYATGGAINPLPLLTDRTSANASTKPGTKHRLVSRKI
jgi:peptidoglycan LD-endopeptidase LytH